MSIRYRSLNSKEEKSAQKLVARISEELRLRQEQGRKCDGCQQRSHSVIEYGRDMLCYECSEPFMMRE